MIKVFYGENRKLMGERVAKFLGADYEIIEGAELEAKDLPNIFLGKSLFTETRAILVRDLLANKAVAEGLAEFLETEHKIAILELKVDKRSNVYKALKDKVEFVECKMPVSVDARAVFDIFAVAKQNGKKAVLMLEKIEQSQDPIMFEGLLISQALKDYVARPSKKTKKVLTELARLDMDLKSSGMEPWLLVKGFLLRLAVLE